uniref:DUF6589 domain-containing protein n=1 Tax=Amphimedon queenslandica TaxID=400682 RepID=A0A1X7TR30_AMPQE
MECLGCGKLTVLGDRRVLGNSPAIFSTWKYLLLTDEGIDESHIASTIKTHIFMCKKCHKNYEKLVSLHGSIKESLSIVKSAVLGIDSGTNTTAEVSQTLNASGKRTLSHSTAAAVVPLAAKMPRTDSEAEEPRKQTVVVTVCDDERTKTSVMTPSRAADVKSSARAKQRVPQLCLPQKVISLLLYSGHCSKKVLNRLNKPNICVSHYTTVRTLVQLGSDHDRRLRQWRDELATGMCLRSDDNCESNVDDSNFPVLEHNPFDLVTDDSDGEDENDNTLKDTSQSEAATSVTSSADERLSVQMMSESSDEGSPVPPAYSDISVDEESDIEANEADEDTDEEGHFEDVFGFKIVGDNIDKNVRPRHNREDRKTISMHYYHSYAVCDRASIYGLSDDIPNLRNTNLLSIPVNEVLPSSADDQILKHNFTVLISRILVQHLQFFADNYNDVVDRHIKHIYYKEMSGKSDVVPLGIELYNEANHDDMLAILERLDDYTPKCDDQVQSILLGGDQMSCAMARRVIADRKNSRTDSQCLKGIIPVVEDWHSKLCFLTACFKLLYKESSVSEKGTLIQLKILLGHNRVTFSQQKITNFDACDDFFKIVLSSHVVTAAMELLNMKNFEDTPANDELFPAEAWLEGTETRKDVLYRFSSQIVKRFVDVDTSFDVRESPSNNEDKVLAYSKLLMSLGMIYLEYCDGIKEGDGMRVLRCWRYMLLIFKATGRTNYSIEAFNMLAQYHFLLSNRQKHQLIWGRFINVHGLPARNIPCDLYMEHLNRVVKEALKGLGANKTEKAMVYVGKAVGALDSVHKNYDYDNCINEGSGSHRAASFSKELRKVVKVLLNEKALQLTLNRTHKSFEGIFNNDKYRKIEL